MFFKLVSFLLKEKQEKQMAEPNMADFVEQLMNGDLLIKLTNGQYLNIDVGRILSNKKSHSITLNHNGSTIATYALMCRICGNNSTPSKHCKGLENWFFCKNCFKNQEKRRELFTSCNVVNPFLNPECSKDKCTLCLDYQKWKKAQRNALNRIQSHVENNDDSDNDDNNNPRILDLTIDNDDNDINNDDDELSKEILSQPKRRRLRRRDGRSLDEDD
jgi:hypothetical protein